MSKTTDILTKIQPKPHEQWNGNLSHRKTIQSQAAEIETLRNKSDALLKVTVDQGEKIVELNSDLEFKSILLRAALADLQRMDEKLLDAQDEFFNLGDACMNRIVGTESPFQYE